MGELSKCELSSFLLRSLRSISPIILYTPIFGSDSLVCRCKRGISVDPIHGMVRHYPLSDVTHLCHTVTEIEDNLGFGGFWETMRWKGQLDCLMVTAGNKSAEAMVDWGVNPVFCVGIRVKIAWTKYIARGNDDKTAVTDIPVRFVGVTEGQVNSEMIVRGNPQPEG